MAEIALRWSGPLLVAGAAMMGAAIVSISLRPVEGQVFTSGASLLLLLLALALLVALPAMYARQANAAGWLGLAGHALLQSGVLLLAVLAATPLLHPALKVGAPEHPVVFSLGIALTLGLLLTAIATLRAAVYPTGAGLLLLAATAGFFFVFFVAEFLPPLTGQIGSAVFGILLALGLAWIGLVLWLGLTPAGL